MLPHFPFLLGAIVLQTMERILGAQNRKIIYCNQVQWVQKTRMEQSVDGKLIDVKSLVSCFEQDFRQLISVSISMGTINTWDPV